jgi:hypothetical protein
VYRNGVEIGRAKIAIRDPEVPLGTHAFTMIEPDAAGTRWIAVGIPGHMGEAQQPLDPEQAARVSIPSAFRSDAAAILTPGATLVVTDSPVLGETTGMPVTVLDGDPPEAPR